MNTNETYAYQQLEQDAISVDYLRGEFHRDQVRAKLCDWILEGSELANATLIDQQ